MYVRKKNQETNGHADDSARKPYRVRLPGIISEEGIGLGDVVKHVTSKVGIKPCGGCDRRAAALNRLLVFSGRPPR